MSGRRFQTQTYVNRRPGELDDAVRAAFTELNAAEFEWVSPLAEDDDRTYRDGGFLARIGLAHLEPERQRFWPDGGPEWDALAIVHRPAAITPGVLLVEAKSHPADLLGDGLDAGPGSAGRTQVERSLTWTQEQLGISEHGLERWCGRRYGSASRLAHLYWLRSLHVDAWLVYLLFIADPSSPTSTETWLAALAEADADLGLTDVPLLGTSHALLTAAERTRRVS